MSSLTSHNFGREDFLIGRPLPRVLCLGDLDILLPIPHKLNFNVLRGV
jgi:hypothetical protein